MHCVFTDATFDTKPVPASFKLPKDGRMHTMSLGTTTGGAVLAVRCPTSDYPGEMTVLEVLRRYCEGGHQGNSTKPCAECGKPVTKELPVMWKGEYYHSECWEDRARSN